LGGWPIHFKKSEYIKEGFDRMICSDRYSLIPPHLPVSMAVIKAVIIQTMIPRSNLE